MLTLSVLLSKLVRTPERSSFHSHFAMTDDVQKFQLEGTVVAPLTPMKPNGDLNLEAFAPYSQFLSDVGVSGIFINGSLGEGMSLTLEERCEAAEQWAKVAQGRIKQVIVHVGATNLRDTMFLAKHAATLNVHAIASVCSIYFKPQSIEDLVAYTEQVAGAAPSLPYFYYDIDFMTGVHLDAVKYLEAAKGRIPTLRGLKYTTPNLHVASLCSQLHDGLYQIAVGTNDQCLPYLSVGLGVTITDTTYASMHVQLKKAYHKDDHTSATKHQHRTTAFTHVISKYGTMVPVAKEIACEICGVDMGPPRLPMTRLPHAQRINLIQELEQLGYFDWTVKFS